MSPSKGHTEIAFVSPALLSILQNVHRAMTNHLRMLEGSYLVCAGRYRSLTTPELLLGELNTNDSLAQLILA